MGHAGPCGWSLKLVIKGGDGAIWCPAHITSWLRLKAAIRATTSSHQHDQLRSQIHKHPLGITGAIPILAHDPDWPMLVLENPFSEPTLVEAELK